jgi:hypothetical protein
MRRPRFSIGSLLAFVAIFALGLAALRTPTRVLASAIHTVAAVAVVTGVSFAIIGRGARRAYWIGFSLFGGAYLLHTLGSQHLLTDPLLDLLYPHVTVGSQSAQITAPVPPVAMSAATSVSVNVLPAPPPTSATTPLVAPSPILATPPVSFAFATPTTSLPTSAWNHWIESDHLSGEFPFEFDPTGRFSSMSYRNIGHSLAALLVATLGGILVRWRYEQNARESPEAAPKPHQADPAPGLSA